MSITIFRADSSSSIGTGHIMRDLVLASRFKDTEIIFVTQNLDGNINQKILDAGYKVKSLKDNSIAEFKKVILKYNPKKIIIDSYNINYSYEKKLKEKYPTIRLMVLDDTYEKHHCDILLNHNIFAKKKKYKSLVPKWCKVKCGSKYTLLRDEFYQQKINILVAMGGADSANLNIKIIQLLKKLKNIKLNIVTTDANKHLKDLKSYVKSKKWIKLHINSTNIAQLIAQSDCNIITPSVVANEVVFMNKPLVAIKVAKNQKNMAKYLKKSSYKVFKIKDIYKLKKVIKRCKQKH